MLFLLNCLNGSLPCWCLSFIRSIKGKSPNSTWRLIYFIFRSSVKSHRLWVTLYNTSFQDQITLVFIVTKKNHQVHCWKYYQDFLHTLISLGSVSQGEHWTHPCWHQPPRSKDDIELILADTNHLEVKTTFNSFLLTQLPRSNDAIELILADTIT